MKELNLNEINQISGGWGWFSSKPATPVEGDAAEALLNADHSRLESAMLSIKGFGEKVRPAAPYVGGVALAGLVGVAGYFGYNHYYDQK